jgi:membrane-associated phospholipid phosphatase
MTSHPWRRAITISVAGLVLAAVVGALFALLVQSQGDWRVGLPWERALMLSIDRTLPTFVDWIMLSLPWLGTNLTLFPIVAAVSLWLWRKKGRGELALQLMVAVVGSLLLNVALKNVFDRPRPELWEHRGQYAWASYPSGHAIVGVATYFTIARMLLRERGWRWPFVAATLMLAIVLYSRLYLGVHWPTDVIGGIVLGVVWLVVVELAFRPQRGKRNQTDALPVDSAVSCPVGHHAHQEA